MEKITYGFDTHFGRCYLIHESVDGETTARHFTTEAARNSRIIELVDFASGSVLVEMKDC